MTQEEAQQIEEWFTYKEISEEQKVRLRAVRVKAMELAATVIDFCPQSADRTAALRKLREAVMTVNHAISHEKENVARVDG